MNLKNDCYIWFKSVLVKIFNKNKIVEISTYKSLRIKENLIRRRVVEVYLN